MKNKKKHVEPRDEVIKSTHYFIYIFFNEMLENAKCLHVSKTSGI